MAENKKHKRSWRKVWGALGLAALFACGVAVGLFYNTTIINKKKASCVPDSQCSDLANKIANTGFDLQKQEELIVLYNQNCFYNKPLKKEIQQVTVTEEKRMPVLKKKPANKDKTTKRTIDVETAERACDVVENLLLKQLKYYSAANSPDANEHYGRAQIYAKLSNMGCEENYDKYRSLAKKEIAIAHALNNNKFQGNKETVAELKEYKKQNKDKEAQEKFTKVKELTDPAIDFILEIEEIMCEE